MSQLYVNQISPTGPALTVNFTGTNPPTYNGMPLGTGGTVGSGTGPLSGYEDPRVIRSTPPAPTALTATGAFRTVILSWELENYINHAFVEIYRNTVNDRDTSILIGKTTTNGYSDVTVTISTNYYYWVRAVNIELVSGAYNAAAGATGVQAAILKIGNTDLGALVVEAAQLADGSITGSKLANNAISSFTKFASGIEPISVVGSLPTVSGYTGSKLVFLTTDNKLYRYTGSAWVASVASTDISGTLTNAQIADLNAAKLTGTLDVARIAANALDATKFATSIEPLGIVSSVPGSKTTNTIFNTTDRKIYRWNGSAYVATVAAADVGNGLTSAQIADLDAAKLTGTLNTARIAANALDATKFATSIEPISIVSSVPGSKSTNTIFNTTDRKIYRWNGSAYVATVPASDLTGTISSAAIADGSIAGTKFASGIEPYTIVSSVPGVKSTNMIFNTTDGKLYRWNGSGYTASIPAADIIGSISTTEIADGSISLTKFASGLEPISVVSSIPGVKSTNSIFNTTDGKLYYWNGSAYVKSVAAADITVGQITSTQIADGAITTPKMTAGTINANVLSAGTITTNLMTANSISGDRLTANSIDAGKIVAGTVTATQIAALGITGAKIAAGTITADKIQANSLTAGQIASNSITGDRITTNSLDAGKITSGTITATQLAAASITGDKIAANTITADKLLANSITSTQIAAGGITADRLAADSITAGQIAAGAIGAAEIAAGVISASKLVLTNTNSILPDPGFRDTTTWGWGSDNSYSVSNGIANEPARFANIIGNMASAKDYLSSYTEVENGAQYRVRLRIKISADAAGWASVSIHFPSQAWICPHPTTSLPEFQSGQVPVIELATTTIPKGSWQTYTTTVLKSSSGIASIRARSSGFMTAGTVSFAWEIVRASSADLIVDGSISTDKMTANSINGDRILANSLSASKIVAGTITTDRFTANSIGGSILQDGTITAGKIAADSITAGQIAAGAIGATEIAAGSITASKVVISNKDDLLLDPGFEDLNWWGFGSDPKFVGVTGIGSTQPRRFCRISSTINPEVDYTTGQIPVEANAKYRVRLRIYLSSTSAGWVALNMHIPNTDWYTPAPRQFLAGIDGGTFPLIDLSTTTIPKGTWSLYEGIATITPNTQGSYTNMRTRAYLTAGYIEFAWEIVRASSADLIVDGAITTDKMTANSINGDRILANSLTASKILAGSITTDRFTANSIGGSILQDGTISASKIVADSITAGQIAAGAIGAAEVAAGAITTNKLLVVPETLCPDPSFKDYAFWSGTLWNSPGWYIEEGTGGATTLGLSRVVSLWADSPGNNPGSAVCHVWSAPIPFSGSGQRLRLRIKINNVSNQAVYAQVYFTSITDSFIGNLFISSAPGSGIQTFTTDGVVPNGVAFIQFIVNNAGGSAFSGSVSAGDFRLDQMASAELIVDGAVTADKVAANAITATKIAANAIAVGTAAIENGAINNAMIANLAVDNAKIANGTITSAKIANLNADVITAGTLSVDRINARSIVTDKIAVGAVTASVMSTGSGEDYVGNDVSTINTGNITRVSYSSTGGALLMTHHCNLLFTTTTPFNHAIIQCDARLDSAPIGAIFGDIVYPVVIGSTYYIQLTRSSSIHIIWATTPALRAFGTITSISLRNSSGGAVSMGSGAANGLMSLTSRTIVQEFKV